MTRGSDGVEAWPRGRSRHGGVDELPLQNAPGNVGGGRLWLCGKHAIGPDPEALLAEIGATTVVCLVEAFELSERYPAYVEWLAANAGGRAVSFPIADLHAPPVEAVLPLLTELRRRLATGESMVIHCAAGIGRSGTIAACLLITLGMDAPSALGHVAAHRPMAGPEVGAQEELVAAVVAAVSPLAP